MELPLHVLPLCCHFHNTGYFHLLEVLPRLGICQSRRLINLRVKCTAFDAIATRAGNALHVMRLPQGLAASSQVCTVPR